MRNIILSIFFFLLADNCFSQQILIKIIMEYRSTDSYGVETILAGYGVEMYYVLGSVDEFKENISEISKFTERDILATFKHPLVEPGFSFGHCDTIDNLQKSNSDFFKRNRSIFIKGVPQKITESYINEMLRKEGRVLRVTLLKDSRGESRGMAFAEFQYPRDALKVVQNYRGKKFEGNDIFVAFKRDNNRFRNNNYPRYFNRNRNPRPNYRPRFNPNGFQRPMRPPRGAIRGRGRGRGRGY